MNLLPSTSWPQDLTPTITHPQRRLRIPNLIIPPTNPIRRINTILLPLQLKIQIHASILIRRYSHPILSFRPCRPNSDSSGVIIVIDAFYAVFVGSESPESVVPEDDEGKLGVVFEGDGEAVGAVDGAAETENGVD